MTESFPPLDITRLWSYVNDDLVDLLDLLPEDKLDWSPRPELWNTKGLLIHILFGRYGLMNFIVKDGKEMPDVLQEAQTKDGLRQHLPLSWERMEAFLRDPEALARTYEAMTLGESGPLTGHELAFGQLEHDIHHRSDVLHHLRALEIPHQEPDTLLRLLRERKS